MLTAVMYHHINSDVSTLSNTDFMLDRHFQYISEHYESCFPGETITAKSICITFDDAYFSFYHYVFPLLKKYNLKAVLAVPTAFILENTEVSAEIRLSLKHKEIYDQNNFQKYSPFCTYEELREMVHSGYVQIASHSVNHINLSASDLDLKYEIIESKSILEEKLQCRIESFVLPYGKYNAEAVELARKHYQYVFRIGNGFNFSWNGIGGLIYRIKGDGLKTPDELFSFRKQVGFWIKTVIKRLKG